MSAQFLGRLIDSATKRRIAALPQQAGHPVPWFVAQLDDGRFDFRVMDGDKLPRAISQNRCWVCGGRLSLDPPSRPPAFVIGPMCAVNRVSAEPPSHLGCAVYSAVHCPFLSTPAMDRRSTRLPDHVPPSGNMITRNPGVALVWPARGWKPFAVAGDGVLFDIGRPAGSLYWFREGRPATREEVLASIDSGYPILLGMAESEGPEAMAALGQMRETAERLVPHG